MLVPKYGVYVTHVTVEGKKRKFYGITNVGVRPTVGGTSLFAETNIFDFSGDLYGKTVKVEFLKFIREERHFENIDSLKEQVLLDITAAKNFISEI